MFSAVELEIELFCRGMRIDESCVLEDARRIARTRAGLGSGLEIVLTGARKPDLGQRPGPRGVRRFLAAPVDRGPRRPPDRRRPNGRRVPGRRPRRARLVRAHDVVGSPDEPHRGPPGQLPRRLRLQRLPVLGLHRRPGPASSARPGRTSASARRSASGSRTSWRSPQAARTESGAIFTHLNTGYHFEDVDRLEAIHGLRQCEPFVRAIRSRSAASSASRRSRCRAGSSASTTRSSTPARTTSPSATSSRIRSFFERLCPGKAETLGQAGFFEAMEYTSRKLGPGRVSGEIIAGLEPIEATKRGIDRIVAAGAFPDGLHLPPHRRQRARGRAAAVARGHAGGLRPPVGGLPARAAARSACCRSRSRSSFSPRSAPHSRLRARVVALSPAPRRPCASRRSRTSRGRGGRPARRGGSLPSPEISRPARSRRGASGPGRGSPSCRCRPGSPSASGSSPEWPSRSSCRSDRRRPGGRAGSE